MPLADFYVCPDGTVLTTNQFVEYINSGLTLDAYLLGINESTDLIPKWSGSGPVAGTLGVNLNSKSVAAIQSYYPKDGWIEFVFDAKTNIFVVGKPQGSNYTGSQHQNLAKTIGADSSSTTLGGTFYRGSNGEIYTTELSGHYGANWTDALREQFVEVMKSYGLDVIHEAWGG